MESQDLSDELAPVVGGERRVFCCHSANLSRSHPGNSLAAVRECVEARVPRLEVDVRFLADDSMLIFHDGSLEAETSGAGRANALDRAAARGLRYKGGDEPLAFLQDVVGAMEGGPTLLQVDLKLMRPISEARARALVEALRPLDGNLIIGTQAHWNLRPLVEAGLPIAFDPTLQINAYPAGREEGMTVPARMGLHGFWDDAPLARIPRASAEEYLQARIADLCMLVPGARELMIDQRTLLLMADKGVAAGAAAGKFGVQVAAWTVRDRGHQETGPLLARLFALGATTIITDSPRELAGYVAAPG